VGRPGKFKKQKKNLQRTKINALRKFPSNTRGFQRRVGKEKQYARKSKRPVKNEERRTIRERKKGRGGRKTLPGGSGKSPKEPRGGKEKRQRFLPNGKQNCGKDGKTGKGFRLKDQGEKRVPGGAIAKRAQSKSKRPRKETGGDKKEKEPAAAGPFWKWKNKNLPKKKSNGAGGDEKRTKRGLFQVTEPNRVPSQARERFENIYRGTTRAPPS